MPQKSMTNIVKKRSLLMESNEKKCCTFISSILKEFSSGVFAITGPAGSGKTSTGEVISMTHASSLYSADYRFIGDSVVRKKLLGQKQARSVADYQDSANQFNWWDWSMIQRDLNELMNGSDVLLDAPYDRASGLNGRPIKISPSKIILFEGAIIGPPDLASKFTKIFFLSTPPTERFERILKKDLQRRSFNDVLARFLITEYSETIYYKNLFSWARDKMIFIDTLTGHPCSEPVLPIDLFVPLRINPNA